MMDDKTLLYAYATASRTICAQTQIEIGSMRLAGNYFLYGGGLVVRPMSSRSGLLGVMEWNDPNLWKEAFAANIREHICFAEDTFGTQFCISDRDGAVYSFNPETGDFDFIATSLKEWAEKLVSDSDFLVGHSFLASWVKTNGPLSPGCRLLPRKPFVLGGEYTTSNFGVCQDVRGMRARAVIANQISDLQDGSKVILVDYNKYMHTF